MIPHGALPSVSAPAYSVISPAVEMRPTAEPAFSVKYSAPSGPRVIPCGNALSERPAENAVTDPDGVILPMYPDAAAPVNHRLPSGPAAISCGRPAGRPPNSVITPAGVILPMRPELNFSVNQTLPSGPAAMPHGEL